MAPRTEQRVEAVERALTILNAFSDGSQDLTLNELSNRTGLYRSTILRLAASLERFGYLYRDAGGRFHLGSALFRLGTLYQRSFRLEDYVRPVLADLAEATEETAAFYVREGERRVCLFRHHADRLFRQNLEEGAELPLDRGASARILMAYSGEAGDLYDRVRRDGYYISFGERDSETVALAVPVFGMGEKLVGALGIALQHNRFNDDFSGEKLPLLQQAAGDLSARLGGFA